MRDVDLQEADGCASGSVEFDSALDRDQLREQIVTILNRLPEQYRLLLKWRYWDQKRTNEIATTLNRTAKAVERMLARARGRFRREWEAENE